MNESSTHYEVHRGRGADRRDQHDAPVRPGDVPRLRCDRPARRGRVSRTGSLPRRRDGVQLRGSRHAARAVVRRRAVPRRRLRDRLALRPVGADRARARPGDQLLRRVRSGRGRPGSGRDGADRRRDGRGRAADVEGRLAVDEAALDRRPDRGRDQHRLADLRRRRLAEPDPEPADPRRLRAPDHGRLQLPAKARHRGRHGLARDRDLRLDRQHLRLAPEPARRARAAAAARDTAAGSGRSRPRTPPASRGPARRGRGRGRSPRRPRARRRRRPP